MSSIQVHDRFIDQVFSDPKNLRDFMRDLLPHSLSSRIDFSTLKIKKTKRTSRKYRRYNLDFIVRALLDKQETEFYFIIEHKSAPEKDSLLQVIGYCLVTYEEDMRKGKPLRPIIPIILYHGKHQWNLPENFADYFEIPSEFREYILQFKYVLIDLSRYDNKEFLEKLEKNVRLYSALYALKNIFEELDNFRPLLFRLIGIDRETASFIIEYIVMARDYPDEQINPLLKELDMPTTAERWIQQGIQQGFQQGIQQGIQQGLLLDAQEMLLEALEERFEIVPNSIAKKIKQIDSREVIKSLFKVAMRTSSLEEFEAKLKIAMK
jgi:predicted transposase/invertase (TIGR01784 family)